MNSFSILARLFKISSFCHRSSWMPKRKLSAKVYAEKIQWLSREIYALLSRLVCRVHFLFSQYVFSACSSANHLLPLHLTSPSQHRLSKNKAMLLSILLNGKKSSLAPHHGESLCSAVEDVQYCWGKPQALVDDTQWKCLCLGHCDVPQHWISSTLLMIPSTKLNILHSTGWYPSVLMISSTLLNTLQLTDNILSQYWTSFQVMMISLHSAAQKFLEGGSLHEWVCWIHSTNVHYSFIHVSRHIIRDTISLAK